MSTVQKKFTISTVAHEMILSKKDKIIADQARLIAALKESLRLQKAKKFSASSEKSPDQQEMFNEAELAIVVEEYLEQQETQQPDLTGKPKKKPGRKPLPVDLPRIRIEHDLDESEKHCACGCQLSLIGEECSEQLDIIPAKIRVLVNVRKKYACKSCEETIKTAALPRQPIPKSNASPGLLAHIATAKYQDALPLYRQEIILQRSGVDIPRNTLASWMMKAGALAQPLISVLNNKQLSYPVLHCDETPLQVLNEPGKTVTSQSYMWVRVGGPSTQPIRLFHYAPSRAGSVISDLLEGYQGYLQTDDYAGYNAVCARNALTQLGCWAHARRKFMDAKKATTSKGKTTTGKADVAISLIAKLYAIEKYIKPLDAQRKFEVRQRESIKELEKLREWLNKTLHNTLPKGLLGKALSYMDKNWKKLTVYTEDGRLSIDNNPAENAIRPFVIGRKNYLFSASVQGAKSSANLYSLIETAKANSIEPCAYLRQVFKKLPQAETLEEIELLLPWNIKLENS